MSFLTGLICTQRYKSVMHRRLKSLQLFTSCLMSAAHKACLYNLLWKDICPPALFLEIFEEQNQVIMPLFPLCNPHFLKGFQISQVLLGQVLLFHSEAHLLSDGFTIRKQFSLCSSLTSAVCLLKDSTYKKKQNNTY